MRETPPIRPAARWRWRGWIALVAGLLLGQVVWIFALRGPRIMSSDSVLCIGQVVLTMGLISIAGLISSTPPDAIRLKNSTSRVIILSGTVLLHLIALCALWPGLSDDVARYRLDGLMWFTGHSPYAVTPRQMMDTGQVDVVDRVVSFQNSFATDPPVAQTLFISARAIEMTCFGRARLDDPRLEKSIRTWRSILPHVSFVHRGLVLRAMMAIAALLCTVLLLAHLRDIHQTPWLAVLFAWNPLIVLETSGNGHVQIVALLLLLVMVRMLQRKKLPLAVLALCLACGVQPVTIVLAPLLIHRIMLLRDWAIARRSAGIAALVLLLVYLPIMAIQHGSAGWISQLRTDAHFQDFNSPLFTYVRMHAQWRAVALFLPALAAAGALLWLIRQEAPIEDSGYWLMLCPLLLAPVASPWRLIATLGFVPIMRHRGGWTALTWAGTASLAYITWHSYSTAVPPALLAAEYLPVYLAFGMQALETFQRPRLTIPLDATVSA